MINNEEDNRKEFLKALKNNSRSLSITDLVTATHLSRSTVRGIISYFKGAGKLDERIVGMAKLYSLKG